MTGPGRPASAAAILSDLLAREPALDAAIARRLRGWGASFGTSVSPDAMCFETTVPPEALEAALELEASRMRPLELPQEELAGVIAARRAQWAAAESDPFTMGVLELNRAAFRGHPYGRPVGGPDEEGGGVTPATIAEEQRERVHAANAVVVVAGRFETRPAMDLIRRHFERLPRRAASRRGSAALPKGAETRTLDLASARTPMVFLGWRGGPASDRDAAALEVLALAIGSGVESLIGRDAGEDDRAYRHAEAHFAGSRDASLLSCMVVPQPGADRAGTEQALVEKIEKLAAEPLAEEDLERAKRQAETRRWFAMQTPAGRAQTLATALTTTGRADDAATLVRLRALTAAEVLRAAAKVLVEANRTVVWISPAAAPETGGEP